MIALLCQHYTAALIRPNSTWLQHQTQVVLSSMQEHSISQSTSQYHGSQCPCIFSMQLHVLHADLWALIVSVSSKVIICFALPLPAPSKISCHLQCDPHVINRSCAKAALSLTPQVLRRCRDVFFHMGQRLPVTTTNRPVWPFLH